MRTIIVKCKVCKKNFERPLVSRREVCSDDCRNTLDKRLKVEYRRRLRQTGPKPRCAHCGDEINTNRGAKYCNKPECQKARKRKNNDAAMMRQVELMRSATSRKCPICGKWFDKRSDMYVTCGGERCVKANARKVKLERARVRREEQRRALEIAEQRRLGEGLHIPQRMPVGAIETIPCPWSSGQLDTLPPGVTSWSDPIMDPMSGGFPMITFNAPVAQEVAA